MKIGYLAIALGMSTGIVNNNKNKSLNNTGRVSDFNNGYEYYNQMNYTAAFQWFSRSAEQGYNKAQHYLGIMYQHGPAIDDKESVRWYLKSAIQRNKFAQFNLGNIMV